MTQPIAICIEDLSPTVDAPRFLRCTALPGRQPGLRIDATGTVLWKEDSGTSCEIWVSADQKLILYRPQGAEAATLLRAGRSLAVPFGKPVVMIDQDEIKTGPRRLRIHIHGESAAVTAPSPLSPQGGSAGLLLRTAAAAAATIGVLAASGCKDVEVRDKPPEPPTIDPPKQQKTLLPPKQNPIEVRDNPPSVIPEPEAKKLPRPPSSTEKQK